jgi:hypothetical protein
LAGRSGETLTLPPPPSHEITSRWRDFSKAALHRSICDQEVACKIGRQFAETRVPLLRQRLEALREEGLVDRDADLEAAATALSSLSFGLAFVDQLVFGADCERLRRVTRHVARVYAAGLAPRLTTGQREPGPWSDDVLLLPWGRTWRGHRFVLAVTCHPPQ